ncbi:MAG TPA: T9SS type A sorting domain-containing protein, partial [Bacteroidia bacterium]|nr:T9SS type A sorting domain-containing protein [Bacteroidia bacterium]
KTSTSLTVTVVNCTGIDNITANSNISIYPNPSNGIITVSIPSANEANTLRITDMIGNEIVKSQMKDVTKNLDLSSLQKGLYTITISNGTEKHIQKLIIQ